MSNHCVGSMPGTPGGQGGRDGSPPDTSSPSTLREESPPDSNLAGSARHIPTAQEWEQFKETIRELRYDRAMTTKDIAQYLRETHGWQVT